MNKPNILYIHSHDTGRYVQPYGHPVPTPNLQKLAEGGVLFRQAYSASSTCSPSRACLLTGQYAHQNGMLGLAHRGFSLNDYSHHLLHTLRKAGYLSVLAGMQHLVGGREDPWKILGYDRFLGNAVARQTGSDVLSVPFLGAAIDFLKDPPSEPFFLSLGFEETHRPYPPLPPRENPGYTLPPAPLPDTPEVRQDMHRFKISARNLDEMIGAVFNTLDLTGLADNTLVICTTDHGLAFPGMKCNLTSHGIGVMLILRGPGGFSGGKVFDSLVSHIDVFPTLCELLDISRPDWLQGVSLMPLVRGEDEEVREAIFAEVNYHAAYEPMRAVRTKRWSYIRRYDGLMGYVPHPVLPNCDDSPSKELWMRNGWREISPNLEAIYDLIFDPNERDNLIDHPRAAESLAEMRMRLQEWMISTDDPLLYGPVPAPEGARLDDPEAISPT